MVPIVLLMSDHSPRITLNVVELVGSPSIWTRSMLPVTLSTTSSTSWFIRKVASAVVNDVWPLSRDRGAERGRAGAIPMRVHENQPLDGHVRQSSDERISVGEPVTDSSFCYSGFHAGGWSFPPASAYRYAGQTISSSLSRARRVVVEGSVSVKPDFGCLLINRT